MANTMSKSELIQRIMDGHRNEIARKDVKGVIDAVAAIGHKELKKTGAFVVPGTRQVHRHQEARHEGASGHQSFHQGAHDLQGKASSEDRQGAAS